MKLFVWDFHGVLEKDNDLDVLYLSNIILKNKGIKKRFSLDDAYKLSGLKWFEYFEFLLPELSHKDHLNLQSDCLKFQRNNRSETQSSKVHKYLKANDYADYVLSEIAKSGHDQLLISNTNPVDIMWFVNRVGLKKHFPDNRIIGINAHQRGTNKNDAFRNFLLDKGYEQIVIIGDSQKDIDLKSVSGGVAYYYKRLNRDHDGIDGADYKIADLREILNEV